jgi:hypothetical protein
MSSSASSRSIVIAASVAIAAVAILVVYNMSKKRKTKAPTRTIIKIPAPATLKTAPARVVDNGTLLEGASIAEIRLHELTTLRDHFPSADILNETYVNKLVIVW